MHSLIGFCLAETLKGFFMFVAPCTVKDPKLINTRAKENFASITFITTNQKKKNMNWLTRTFEENSHNLIREEPTLITEHLETPVTNCCMSYISLEPGTSGNASESHQSAMSNTVTVFSIFQ